MKTYDKLRLNKLRPMRAVQRWEDFRMYRPHFANRI